MNFLTRKEELILMAVLKLGESASLVKIREYLVISTGQKWSVGNVYVPLDRMSRMDYLTTTVGAPTSSRGGKAVKYYRLTQNGTQALRALKKVNDRMRAGVPGFLCTVCFQNSTVLILRVILMKYTTVFMERKGKGGLVSDTGANVSSRSPKSSLIQSIGVLSCLKTILLSHYAT